jgi:hypothetical protein
MMGAFGAVVSIIGPVCVRPVSVKVAVLPLPSLIVALFGRLTEVTERAEVFWPAATVVLNTSDDVPEPLT